MEKIFEFKTIALIPILNYYFSQKLKFTQLDVLPGFQFCSSKFFSLDVCFFMNFELKFFFELLRVGISLPTIEVRFEHLNVAAEVHVGSRALSTFLNFSVNILEVTMCRYVQHLLI